jgi:putative tricarboxylic transport membrane protein
VNHLSRRTELLTAICLFIFSLVYAVGSLKLKIGQLSNPGSGLMPLLIGILLLLCSFIYLLMALVHNRPQNGKKDHSEETSKSHIIPLAIAGLILIYPFILIYLGFLISTFLILWPMFVLLRFKNAYVSLLATALMVAATYLLFSVGLGVSLPSGPLEELIMTF